jgi:hypothetical protein
MIETGDYRTAVHTYMYAPETGRLFHDDDKDDDDDDDAESASGAARSDVTDMQRGVTRFRLLASRLHVLDALSIF